MYKEDLALNNQHWFDMPSSQTKNQIIYDNNNK